MNWHVLSICWALSYVHFWSPFAVNNLEKSKLRELTLGLLLFMMCLLLNQNWIYLYLQLVSVSVSNFPEHFSSDLAISLKKSQTVILRHHHLDLKNKGWNTCGFIVQASLQFLSCSASYISFSSWIGIMWDLGLFHRTVVTVYWRLNVS